MSRGAGPGGEGPPDAVEQVVRQAWGATLGTDTAGPHDDFFAAGGSSLAAVRLVGDIRRALRTDVPLGALFEAPTIDGLARLIRQRSAPSTSYVRLRSAERDTTFVFVHPVGGSVSGYTDVVAALPPGAGCVGLQARGLDPRCEPHPDIPSMAADYLAELSARHRPEDLVLGGYSFGGLVAFEMAHQLGRAGRPPRGVVLLGTYFPQRDVTRAGRIETLSALVGAIYRTPVDPRALDGLDDDAVVGALAAAACGNASLPEQYRHAGLRRLIEVLARNLAMVEAFDVPVIEGQVHLVRPESPEPRDVPTAWRRHARGGAVAHDIGGEHNALMSQPHGSRIARLLAELWPA
ncbi:alpha/beta fold hydrolase [Actinacidiphila yeochonensis]|uniref:alpha/beta fold hydrolase n=1 Tax=Actinacidiphila yeochonensis TaxID=89050 RepID=UPI0005660E37|nr:alpha/beta fold hydrolase [Actinacidiphila yeochonensis]